MLNSNALHLCRRGFLIFSTCSLMGLSSCAKIKDPCARNVSSIVAERSGYNVDWERKTHCSKQEAIDALLQSELTVDSAIQIALFNNPRLQALFEEIGIAEADLINASLLANPVFGAAVRFPDQKRAFWNTELDLLQPFVDLLLQPLRRKTASLELAEVSARVSDALFAFIEEVSVAYHALHAQIRHLYYDDLLVELLGLKFEIASKRYAVGNANAFERDKYLAIWQNAVLHDRSAQMELIQLKEELAHLLGVPSECWTISLELHLPPAPIPSKEDLINYALCARLDLQALRLKMEQLVQSYGLYEWWTYTEAAVGAAYEKDTDGSITLGPGAVLALPLFNFGQGDRHRVCAELWQTFQMYRDLQLEIVRDVKTAYDNLTLAETQLMEIVQDTIPDRERLIGEAIRLHNFMNADVYDVLDTKTFEVEAQQMRVEAIRDYWEHRVRLERAIGGACL